MGGGLSITPVEVDSPTEGVLSRLWSVLSTSLSGIILDGSWAITFILGLLLLSLWAGVC